MKSLDVSDLEFEEGSENDTNSRKVLNAIGMQFDDDYNALENSENEQTRLCAHICVVRNAFNLEVCFTLEICFYLRQSAMISLECGK